MTRRIFFFGCSHTYGVGLPDCYKNQKKPSNLGWAAYIAKHLNGKYINKSSSGASNKLIWHKIKKTKFKPSDIVFVLWSYPSRGTIFTSPWTHIDLHHNSLDSPESNAYYKYIYSIHDSLEMSKLFINDATNYLNKSGVTLYQTVAFHRHKILFGDIPHVPIYFSKHETAWPKALDNHHVGVEGNIAFANAFLNHIGYTTTESIEDKSLNKLKRWFDFHMNIFATRWKEYSRLILLRNKK